MAAWNHSRTTVWNSETYLDYRKYVMAEAPRYRGRSEDCADLSMMLLIDFAARNGLAVTFEDNAGKRYISKAQGVIATSFWDKSILVTDDSWSTPKEFTKIVQDRIGVEALWKHNTVNNQAGPLAGDLMIIWGLRGTALWNYQFRHHAALVIRPYPVGVSHPKWNDMSVPNFPGPDEAEKQVNQTEYFKGTMQPMLGITYHRMPDLDLHFDYLNSRSDAKRNAEVIYFANARQAVDEGFEFHQYGKNVLENWLDWDGEDTPPR